MSLILDTAKNILKKEAEALLLFSQTLGTSFETAAETILQCKGTVILTGIGKSGIVARKWASTFSSTGTKSYFINPGEASHGDLGIIHTDDVLIALSFSGESEELKPIIRYAREIEIPIISITGNAQSTLARESLIHLNIEMSEEACVMGLAPTTSTTLMMALGDALAMCLVERRGFTSTDFAKLHPGGALGRRLWLKVESLMHKGEAIPTVTPETPLKDVLLEMTKKILGTTVVLEGNNILGIITDGDLRRYFQTDAFQLNAKAQDLMKKDPKTILQDSLAFEAREIMEKNAIQQLIVKNNRGELVGLLHIQDLLRAKVV